MHYSTRTTQDRQSTLEGYSLINQKVIMKYEPINRCRAQAHSRDSNDICGVWGSAKLMLKRMARV